MRIDVVNELNGYVSEEKLPRNEYLQNLARKEKVNKIEDSDEGLLYSEHNQKILHLVKTKDERRLRDYLYNSKFARTVKKEQTFDYKKLNFSGELEVTDKIIFPFSDIIEYGQNSFVIERPRVVKEERYFYRGDTKRKSRTVYKVEEHIRIEKPEQPTEPVVMWDVEAEILYTLLNSDKNVGGISFSKYGKTKENLHSLLSEGFILEKRDGTIKITESGKRRFAEYLYKWWQTIPSSHRDIYESKLLPDYLRMAKCGSMKCEPETKKVLKKKLSKTEFESLLKDYRNLNFEGHEKEEETKKDFIMSYGVPSHLVEKVRASLEGNGKIHLRFLTKNKKRKVKRPKPLYKRNKDRTTLHEDRMEEFVKKLEPDQLKYFIGKPMYGTWLTEEFLEKRLPDKFEELKLQKQISG